MADSTPEAAPSPGMSEGSPPPSPTGAQFAIQHADHVVRLTEVGAALRTYTVAGRPVVDGFEADQPITGGRGQTLIPWPNRIRGGAYTWKGSAQQLDLSEPEKRNAIHGLTRWANWKVLEHRAARIRLGHVLHACPGWPFVLGCELEYSVDAAGLTVRTRVTNLGREACPYGGGAHPYLTLGTRTVDEVSLQVPAGLFLPVDEQGIPTGGRPVDGTPWDFRAPRRIGSQPLDVTYTAIERDTDGRARVWLQAEDGARLSLWLGQGYEYLQLYSGDTLPEVDQRRRGLAVEPMTCPPDAFNSGIGLQVLEPGATHTALWGISPGFGASHDGLVE